MAAENTSLTESAPLHFEPDSLERQFVELGKTHLLAEERDILLEILDIFAHTRLVQLGLLKGPISQVDDYFTQGFFEKTEQLISGQKHNPQEQKKINLEELERLIRNYLGTPVCLYHDHNGLIPAIINYNGYGQTIGSLNKKISQLPDDFCEARYNMGKLLANQSDDQSQLRAALQAYSFSPTFPSLEEFLIRLRSHIDDQAMKKLQDALFREAQTRSMERLLLGGDITTGTQYLEQYAVDFSQLFSPEAEKSSGKELNILVQRFSKNIVGAA